MSANLPSFDIDLTSDNPEGLHFFQTEEGIVALSINYFAAKCVPLIPDKGDLLSQFQVRVWTTSEIEFSFNATLVLGQRQIPPKRGSVYNVW